MPLIQHKVDLTQQNTFGLSAFAEQYCVLHTIDDLLELIQTSSFKKRSTLIMGGGSNLLFATSSFKGLVIKNEIKGTTLVAEDNDKVLVNVSSGEIWHHFVLHCIQNGWGGVENLSLIPGTVGAAPIQNIGAYGVEVKDIIEDVEAVYLKSGVIEHFTNADCHFGYRDSFFKNQGKGKYFISSVTLRLTKRNHDLRTNYGAIQQTLTSLGIINPTIKDISDAVISIRSSKLPDPSKIGNAGSFFKNPSITNEQFVMIKEKYPTIPSYPGENDLIKLPAAWLIEQCGFKGLTRDNIGVHKDQALVLVNYGNGRGIDIWNLSKEIQEHVHKKFDILLTPEVNIIHD